MLYDGRIVYHVSRDLTSTAGQEDASYRYISMCVCVSACLCACVCYCYCSVWAKRACRLVRLMKQFGSDDGPLLSSLF